MTTTTGLIDPPDDLEPVLQAAASEGELQGGRVDDTDDKDEAEDEDEEVDEEDDADDSDDDDDDDDEDEDVDEGEQI